MYLVVQFVDYLNITRHFLLPLLFAVMEDHRLVSEHKQAFVFGSVRCRTGPMLGCACLWALHVRRWGGLGLCRGLPGASCVSKDTELLWWSWGHQRRDWWGKSQLEPHPLFHAGCFLPNLGGQKIVLRAHALVWLWVYSIFCVFFSLFLWFFFSLEMKTKKWLWRPNSNGGGFKTNRICNNKSTYIRFDQSFWGWQTENLFHGNMRGFSPFFTNER